MSSNICQKTYISRHTSLQKTETVLYTWITDQRIKGVPLDTNVILCKAKTLYEKLQSEQQGQNPNYRFSAGWFARFKTRYNLRNIRLHGEAASSD